MIFQLLRFNIVKVFILKTSVMNKKIGVGKVISKLRFDVLRIISLILGVIITFSCTSPNDVISQPDMNEPILPEMPSQDEVGFLHNVDLNNWKVTLPIGNPTEVEPPAILDYANNQLLKDFMYDDASDSSLVFYTYPGSTTQNSSYSRTELREQMVPGSNSVNWKFSDGGVMEGVLALDDISKDAEGKFHRTMVMQIHGRLSNQQRDIIGASSNNAPPILKVYWQKGRVRLLTKKLKDPDVSDLDILKTSSWTDDEGHYFDEVVDNGRFKLKIEASFGKLVVTFNDSETKVYEGPDWERWDVFENYFKAGNYLQTIDEGAFSKVKYYSLEVKH